MHNCHNASKTWLDSVGSFNSSQNAISIHFCGCRIVIGRRSIVPTIIDIKCVKCIGFYQPDAISLQKKNNTRMCIVEHRLRYSIFVRIVYHSSTSDAQSLIFVVQYKGATHCIDASYEGTGLGKQNSCILLR